MENDELVRLRSLKPETHGLSPGAVCMAERICLYGQIVPRGIKRYFTADGIVKLREVDTVRNTVEEVEWATELMDWNLMARICMY